MLRIVDDVRIKIQTFEGHIFILKLVAQPLFLGVSSYLQI